MISLSLIAAHARSASSRLGIWMNPKPLDLPQSHRIDLAERLEFLAELRLGHVVAEVADVDLHRAVGRGGMRLALLERLVVAAGLGTALVGTVGPGLAATGAEQAADDAGRQHAGHKRSHGKGDCRALVGLEELADSVDDTVHFSSTPFLLLLLSLSAAGSQPGEDWIVVNYCDSHRAISCGSDGAACVAPSPRSGGCARGSR